MGEELGTFGARESNRSARRQFLALGGLGALTAAAALDRPSAAHAAVGAVESVNGMIGDVVLRSFDVGAASLDDMDAVVVVASPTRFPGIDPTGAAECADAVQTAFNAVGPGGTLFIPPGTYRLGKPIEVPSNITISAAHGRATFVRDGHTGVQLRAYGSYSDAVTLNGAPSLSTISIAGVDNAVTQITLSSAQPWAPGDIVKIFSEDVIPGGRARPDTAEKPRIGEFMRVHSVSGANVVLTGQPVDSYQTNVRAARLDDKTITIEGLAFDVSDASFANSTAPEAVLRCDSLRAPRLTGVRIKRAVGIGIQMRSCAGYVIDGAEINHAINNPDAGIFGYGIHDVGSNGGMILGGIARFVRHGYSDKSTDTPTTSNDPRLYGRTLHTKVFGMEVVAPSGSAFDTHQESYGVHFNSCVARVGLTSGFALRGSGHRISDSVVYGGDIAVKVFTEGGGGDGETRNIQVTNLRSENCKQVIVTSIRESDHPFIGVQDTERTLTVNGVVARGVHRFATIVNSRVRITNFEITSGDLPDLVFFQNTNSRLELTGGTLDFEAVTQTESARNRILRSSASTPSPYSLIVIRDLRVKASSHYVSRSSLGPFETDATTDIDAFVENERAFPVMPGVLAETDRCTFGWRTLTINDTLTASLSSSGSITYVNAALTGSLVAATRTPDENVLILATLSDGVSRVLGKLGKARKTGQRLSILVASATGTSKLTVKHGSAYGVRLVGATSVELGSGQQLHLFWTGTIWMQVV